MEVRRINPEGGFVREIIDLRKRVQSQETRASGNIVIRETLQTTDPETGVATIVGQLPDGSYGIQPFVYDITPPPVATTPIVAAVPGVISITWDGQFVNGELAPRDFTRLNIIGHKMDGEITVSSFVVGEILNASNIIYISSDVIPVGDTWTFSFEAEDYNTNRAEWSARSVPVTMQDVLANVDVALTDLQTEVDAANAAAADAQSAAAAADSKAVQAASDALAASNLAGTKGKVLIQPTAPTGSDANAQTLWIDTTAGANTPKKWVSGTTWTAVTDKAATDAAAAAVAAQTKADQAFNNAASAATAAGNAQTSADSKNRVWYQTTAPAGTAHKMGDTWFDTDDGNRVYLWTGAAWTDHRDTGIAAAQTSANTALTSANGKNKNYYQTTMPTGGTYILGDTWFDTDDGNKIYVHNGTTFVNAQDASIAAAQSTATTANGTANTALSTANNKTKTYFQTAQPSLTGNTVGDLWFDTDDSNRVYAWNGASWASARDAGIASAASAASTAQQDATAALTAAQAAQAVADGAIRTFYQSAAPTGLNDTTNVGDLWFDIDDGQAYRWNGTAWVIIEDNSIAAALAAAQNAQTTADGKITSYYQPGQPATGEVGDLWFDTDDKNKPYYCSSIAPLTWTVVRDGTIADAQSTANTALTAANGKNVNYYQTTMPSGGTYIKGDTWFDTDDGNKIYVHNGTTFVSAQDTAIAAAQSTATSKTKTFVSATAPTATTQGDIWIDTANGNVIKTWEGSAWVNRADTAIAAAQTAANSAQTSANGRNKIYYQTTMPSGGTYIAGDTWFDTDDGNKIYVHNGTTFVAAPLGTNAIANLAITDAQIAAATISNAKIANLDAAKITTGTLDANRIGANSITANKIFVGDMTNLASDGNFTDLTKASWTGSGTVTVSAGEPNRLRVVTAASGNNDQPNINNFQVTPGEQIYAEAWVYGEAANVGNGGPNIHLMVKFNDGSTQWPSFDSKTRAAVSGAWTLLKGKVTIPANAVSAKVEPAVSFSADAVGNIYYFRNITVRRMATGSLIVDGAIQAGSAIIGTGAIGTAQIGDLAVTNAKIADATIQSAKIGSVDAGTISVGTLSAARIGADTITSAHIASDAITANELAANSITAAKGQISDLAVTNAKIADLAVTNAKIADATIASAKIAALDAGKITSGTIDANRIGANTINVTKLAVSDFTNLATLDEVNGVNVTSYGQTQIVGGYAKLVTDSGTFLMFTDRRGPVPFKTGDRLYYEFTAKATAATTATFTVYTYDALDGNTSVTSGNLNIGTTDTLIKGELIVSNVRPNAVQFVLGLSGVANKGIQVKGIRVYKKLGGELVVDGSITTNHMTSGTIDASVLTAGSITAPKIAAKTITADKLVISSTDNLVVGADFSNGAASWQQSANVTPLPTGGRGSTTALRFTGSVATLTSLNLTNRVTVEPDNRFRCSIFVKSSAALAADTVRLMVRCYTTATAYTDIVGTSNSLLVVGAWTQVKGISPTLPANTIAVEFYLQVTNNATGTTTDIDYVSVTRAFDGNLVVDGAIDGQTITGATVRTAASGARIVLDQNALNAWNTAGDNYFNMSSATGVNISSRGQAGFDITSMNHCTNPSFEVDISGWTSAQTIVRDTTQFYVGTASLKATHTATADRIVSRKQGAFISGDYTASAYVRHNAATAKNMRINFYWLDINGVVLATGGTFLGTIASVPANTWTRVAVTSQGGKPSNASNMRIDIVGVGFTSTETMWADAVLWENEYNTVKPYYDGSTPESGSLSYSWSGPAHLSEAHERTARDIKIKTGGIDVLNPGTGLSKQAPGVGFILPTPTLQTAGLFSDGTTVSLIEGASDPQLTRIDVGNSQIYAWSYDRTDIQSGGNIWIGTTGAGSVTLSGSDVSLYGPVHAQSTIDSPKYLVNGVEMDAGVVQTFNSNAQITSGFVTDLGNITYKADASTSSSLFSISGSTYTAQEPGVYDIFVQFSFDGMANGRAFAEITHNSDTYAGARSAFQSTEDSCSVVLAGLKMDVGDTFKVRAYVSHGYGGARTGGATTRIKKVAAPAPVSQWSTGNLTLDGDLNVSGKFNAKHRRVEFINDGFQVVGGQGWDSGPVTMDTSGPARTTDSAMCSAGPFAGSITFNESGYYMISLFIIPQGVNPGQGWTRLNHSSGESLVQVMNSAWMYETYACTVPVHFQAGEYVRSSLSYPYTHTIKSRWKIVKMYSS